MYKEQFALLLLLVTLGAIRGFIIPAGKCRIPAVKPIITDVDRIANFHQWQILYASKAYDGIDHEDRQSRVTGLNWYNLTDTRTLFVQAFSRYSDHKKDDYYVERYYQPIAKVTQVTDYRLQTSTLESMVMAFMKRIPYEQLPIVLFCSRTNGTIDVYTFTIENIDAVLYEYYVDQSGTKHTFKIILLDQSLRDDALLYYRCSDDGGLLVLDVDLAQDEHLHLNDYQRLSTSLAGGDSDMTTSNQHHRHWK